MCGAVPRELLSWMTAATDRNCAMCLMFPIPAGVKTPAQLYLWQYRPEHEAPVTETLEKAYDIPAEHGLADQLEKVAARLADEYWSENQRDILHIVDGSFLEEYDDFNIGVAFRSAATVSITYALMSRCGLEPEAYFEHEVKGRGLMER